MQHCRADVNDYSACVARSRAATIRAIRNPARISFPGSVWERRAGQSTSPSSRARTITAPHSIGGIPPPRRRRVRHRLLRRPDQRRPKSNSDVQTACGVNRRPLPVDEPTAARGNRSTRELQYRGAYRPRTRSRPRRGGNRDIAARFPPARFDPRSLHLSSPARRRSFPQRFPELFPPRSPNSAGPDIRSGQSPGQFPPQRPART